MYFIKSLDCLEHKKDKMPVFQKINYIPEINKNRAIAKSMVKPLVADLQTEQISSSITKLLEKEMTVTEFSGKMRSLNVKIDTLPVQKMLREIENGVDVPYRKAMSCVVKNKDQENLNKPFEEFIKQIHPKQAHMESKSLIQLSPKNKKKLITTPTYMSQKEIYDWESNILNEEGKRAPSVHRRNNSSLVSKVFSKADENDVMKFKTSNITNRKNETSINTISSTSKLAKHVEIDLLNSKKNIRVKYKNNSTINLSTPKGKYESNSSHNFPKTKSIKNKTSLDLSFNSISTMTTIKLPQKNMKLHMTSQENFLAK